MVGVFPASSLGSSESVIPMPGRQGFASMPRAQRRAIARQGGLATQRAGTAYTFTPETAREAGRLGGTKSKGGRGAAYIKKADRIALGLQQCRLCGAVLDLPPNDESTDLPPAA